MTDPMAEGYVRRWVGDRVTRAAEDGTVVRVVGHLVTGLGRHRGVTPVRQPAAMRRLDVRAALAIVLVVSACGPTAGPTGTAGFPAEAPIASTPTSSPAVTSPTSSPPVPTATASPAATVAPATAPPASPAAPSAWSQIRPDGEVPGAREDHTWTVGGDGTQAYLFGGRSGDRVYGDLWRYDLAADRWQRLRPAGEPPAARFGHEAAWVEGLGLVVFAGQTGPTTFFGDLHVYEPGDAGHGAWRRLAGRGAAPVPRYGSCMALGPDGRLWISHGFTEDGTRFGDTRAYDPVTGTWTDETPAGPVPVVRCLHGCWFEPDGQFVLYAGQTTGVAALGDLWTLTAPGSPGAAWVRTDAAGPADRRLYAHAALADGRRLVFGGGGLDGRFHDDLYTVDPSTEAFTAVAIAAAAPPARAAAELIVDAARGRALLFGGKDGSRRFGDLWTATLPALE